LEYSRDFEGYNWEEIAKKIGVSFKIKKRQTELQDNV
jgi:hypothetical protein